MTIDSRLITASIALGTLIIAGFYAASLVNTYLAAVGL